MLVGEAGVETMVMAGQKGTGAGCTIGDMGAAAGAGASDCIAVGGSYIYERASGRAGTFKCTFGMRIGSLSSSSEASVSDSSSELIPPSSSYSGLCWCERVVPTPFV